MLKCFLLDFLKDFELNYLSFLDLQRSGTLENVILKSFSGFVNQMFPEKSICRTHGKARSTSDLSFRGSFTRSDALTAETKIIISPNLPYESASLFDGLCLRHHNHHSSLPSRQHHAMNIHE